MKIPYTNMRNIFECIITNYVFDGNALLSKSDLHGIKRFRYYERLCIEYWFDVIQRAKMSRVELSAAFEQLETCQLESLVFDAIIGILESKFKNKNQFS